MMNSVLEILVSKHLGNIPLGCMVSGVTGDTGRELRAKTSLRKPVGE